MTARPAAGRGLFYTRDSEGHSDLAPPQYVAWARREAARLGVAFAGTPEAMEAMIARGVSAEGDLFIDYGISGNILSRPGVRRVPQPRPAGPGGLAPVRAAAGPDRPTR